MSSKGSAQRLQIECHNNLRLQALYFITNIIAAICLLISPLSSSLTLFSLLLLLSMAWRTWFARCELGGERVSLLWDSEGRWWWQQGGSEREMLLDGSSYLSTWMIILNLREPAKKRVCSILLFPSVTGDELFRRLTVRLKLEGALPADPEYIIDSKS